ncbi:hypothetical protein LWI29_026710 [Acer saccharum]|uniref:Protein kinase domain-containing protein n=1 Tax=Acer saccharum TaxID=4024 RepID=A0AA39RXH1_ACESA|nr:hypothetical protein LWI29_026710 [Acer saccharum]
MGSANCGVFVGWVVVVVALAAPFCAGVTDPRDVVAINSLYVALGIPPLDKWMPVGGDPCGDQWKGVLCVFSNVTEIRLNGMNLGGNLGDSLGNLKSVINMKDGNPFNTTIILSPPAALPPSPAEAPSSGEEPKIQTDGPSAIYIPNSKSSTARKFSTTTVVIWVAVTGALILFALGVCLFMWRCCKCRQKSGDAEMDNVEKSNDSKASIQPSSRLEKVPMEPVVKPQNGYGLDGRRMVTTPVPQDEQLPPPPLPFPQVEKRVKVKPLAVPAEVATKSHTSKNLNSSSVSVFTIASLQQYTNSFSEDNFIGQGMLGSVYRAELPDGKLLAVKKLSTTALRRQSDEEFLELVSRISELRHANIVELVGYCNEHQQHLLVYEYCANGTLHDLLHVDEESHKKFSWNMRIRVALGASRALQYLHDGCEPPIVHRNFKSANILLDEKLAVHVSDCGLSPLLSSGSTSEVIFRVGSSDPANSKLSGRLLTAHGYSAPEFESGNYTCQSDVYSLGVVMLEILTGRKSFDRSRPRGEHSLVRWAIPQLHDIDALSRMVDPSLNGAYPVKSLSRFADIISRCVQWEPGFRPPMSEIVQDLLHMI